MDIFVEQGATFNSTISLIDVNGNPYDLTNINVYSSMKKSYYTQNTTATFDTAISGSSVDGIITLGLSSDITANIRSGRYLYDIILVDSANTVTRVLEGIVTLVPGITMRNEVT